MRVALFVPCYIDQLYPKVAVATLELLEKLGCEVVYPLDQTCCGQPMANAGFEDDGHAALHLFEKNFEGFEHIVAPSGSCVLHVKEHGAHGLKDRIFELAEFLVDVLKVKKLDARFAHRVGLHESCHGLRGLRLGVSSERNEPAYSKVRYLLNLVEGIELVDLDRRDECCGFGGTFCVKYPDISNNMVSRKMADAVSTGAPCLVAGDLGCILNMEGKAHRDGMDIEVIHFAELLTRSER